MGWSGYNVDLFSRQGSVATRRSLQVYLLLLHQGMNELRRLPSNSVRQL